MALPKSQTGNIEAGNAVECAFAALAVSNNMVPPAINTSNDKLNLARSASAANRQCRRLHRLEHRRPECGFGVQEGVSDLKHRRGSRATRDPARRKSRSEL